MRKVIFTAVLILAHASVNAQIIADHKVVDEFDSIPRQYIDSVRTMLVDLSGESHSLAYRLGVHLLEMTDTSYQAETYTNAAPLADTDQYLRIGRHITMGEEYFFSKSKIEELKAGITSQNNTGNAFDVMGFGWCWDMSWKNDAGGIEDTVYNVRWAGSSVGGPDGSMRWGLDSEDQALTGNSVNMDTYLEAVESYIRYCVDSVYPTKWIFTTGPVDDFSGTEQGFQREIKHSYIRDYVLEDSSRILFDYADILCWNHNGDQYMVDWLDGDSVRPHAQIHPDNMMDFDQAWNLIPHSEDGDHIGEQGALRIAKAMWWMLARMAGWEGVPVLVSEIFISPEGGLTELPFGDSLQYMFQVTPENATSKDVDWRLLPLTGMASISAEGLLKAEDSGLVQVVATAVDGSGVADTVELTILEPPVQVAEITIFSEGEIDLILSGETLQYTVVVLPEDAENKEVDWNVINATGMASITQDGLLTAGVPGSVAIRARARDGSGIADTSFLSIMPPVIPVSDIEISSANDSTSLESGSSLQFSALIIPAEASNMYVEWSVINGTGTASISETGMLTAGNPGSVTVRATARDGSGVSDDFLINITRPVLMVTTISISSGGGVTELESGATLHFSAAVLPADATNREIDWSIENGTGTASITETGLLTSGNPGTVTVRATARDGSDVSDDFLLSVTRPALMVTSITVSSSGGITVLESGATLYFSATVQPADATNRDIEWSVDNGTGSATITSAGLLTANNPGRVSIIASAKDGSGVQDEFDLDISIPTIKVEEISIRSEGNVSSLEEGNMLQLYTSVSPSNADNGSVAWHVTIATKGTGGGTITEDGMFIALSQGDVDIVAVAMDGSGVSDMLTLIVLGPSNISENGIETVRLYPNPGSGLFFLSVGDLKVEQLKVFDVHGSVVLEMIPEPGNQVLELDLSVQPAGFYFINIFTADHFLLKRAIIID